MTHIVDQESFLPEIDDQLVENLDILTMVYLSQCDTHWNKFLKKKLSDLKFPKIKECGCCGGNFKVFGRVTHDGYTYGVEEVYNIRKDLAVLACATCWYCCLDCLDCTNKIRPRCKKHPDGSIGRLVHRIK